MEQIMELLEFFFYFEFHFEELGNIRLWSYSCLSVENVEQNECQSVKIMTTRKRFKNLKFIKKSEENKMEEITIEVDDFIYNLIIAEAIEKNLTVNEVVCQKIREFDIEANLLEKEKSEELKCQKN